MMFPLATGWYETSPLYEFSESRRHKLEFANTKLEQTGAIVINPPTATAITQDMPFTNPSSVVKSSRVRSSLISTVAKSRPLALAANEIAFFPAQSSTPAKVRSVVAHWVSAKTPRAVRPKTSKLAMASILSQKIQTHCSVYPRSPGLAFCKRAPAGVRNNLNAMRARIGVKMQV